MISALPSTWLAATARIADYSKGDLVDDSARTTQSLQYLLPEICEQCPSGPSPLRLKVCQRCIVDCVAGEERKNIVKAQRFTYRGVDFTDALLYPLLPQLLPEGDPGL